MHMLSEIMEHKLHKDCPPNCQDILTWLPTSIIHHILKFLDPGNQWYLFDHSITLKSQTVKNGIFHLLLINFVFIFVKGT